MKRITAEDRDAVMAATAKATLVALGEDQDYSDVPERFMGLFLDVIEDVRDCIRELESESERGG